MNSGHTVSSYLIHQLQANGVRHVFGVPGDYVLGFYKQLEDSSLEVVNTCDEQGAGFAADAYARMRGLGVVCITYCVGGLKVANTTAQAFAEKSPVVVISGAPGTNERAKKRHLHHKVRDVETQLNVFRQLTVASTVLDDPETACDEITRVLATARRYRRPVYIELPRDMVVAPVIPRPQRPKKPEPRDTRPLKEALQEATAMINEATQPVIIAGVEMHRFGYQDLLHDFLVRTGIPVAATILSKSILMETHPQYLGVYEGAMGREEVREYVEGSDCLIMLGVFLSDVNLGVFTARLNHPHSIYVTSEKVSIGFHRYEEVEMEEFIRGLTESGIRQRQLGRIPHPSAPRCPEPVPGRQVRVRYLFQRLNAFLDDSTAVVADPGDAMFGAVDMTIHRAAEFLSPAYYTSLGFAVPAGLGVQLARPDLRPLILVGDGAFQMTGMELASIARYGLNPIIVVLNNRGYGTERPMLDGKFNDVALWHYHRIPEVLGTGTGYEVRTEDELEAALGEARANGDSFSLLNVHLDQNDRSVALERLTATLRKQISKPE